MGKNDLWIAATSSFYGLTLVTTDKYFNHLSKEFIKLENIEIEKYRK
jgi:predicted nucleic acid-binding protein